ncbi:MAG: META domain-containing protein [Parasphingorhabdus sp.]|uniref:META domain-containing protein n=1 Tax=Parasphingorhabdus sp. TaxID=2709688 RepID=UPI0030032A91
MPKQAEHDTAPSIIDFEGQWRVVSIDGETLPANLRDGKPPQLSLARTSIGGNLGCNSFGALSLYVDGRIAAHSWSSTAMYCGDISEQEQALSGLLFGHPTVTKEGNELRIHTSDHEVILADRSVLGPFSPDPAPQTIAATRWRINFIDQKEASSSPQDRILEFTTTGWRGLASCATLFGTFKRSDDRLIIADEIGTTEQNCRADHASLDDRFAALMRSDPHYLVGQNGELIIMGGGHVLTGGRAE